TRRRDRIAVGNPNWDNAYGTVGGITSPGPLTHSELAEPNQYGWFVLSKTCFAH
ncbi:unnamed protein product, partial [Allacma fusca]